MYLLPTITINEMRTKDIGFIFNFATIFLPSSEDVANAANGPTPIIGP